MVCTINLMVPKEYGKDPESLAAAVDKIMTGVQELTNAVSGSEQVATDEGEEEMPTEKMKCPHCGEEM